MPYPTRSVAKLIGQLVAQLGIADFRAAGYLDFVVDAFDALDVVNAPVGVFLIRVQLDGAGEGDVPPCDSSGDILQSFIVQSLLYVGLDVAQFESLLAA